MYMDKAVRLSIPVGLIIRFLTPWSLVNSCNVNCLHCVSLLQVVVLEGRSGRSVVLPAPSHVTTITHHWPAQSSVWRDVSVLRELFYMRKNVLPSLIALIILVCLWLV